MKFSYKHLIKYIPENPSIEELSNKLLQLGHEHEIVNNIFEMEFTPNRGDCLSINGLLRDLAIFYKVNLNQKIYEKDIKPYDINFTNNAVDECNNISFLKIEIEKDISPYHGELEDYFLDLQINKNNFFTDISNYISYETGQPTHCYDASKINSDISLEILEQEYEFETLLDQKIKLKDKNLVFMMNKEPINLAGIMGAKFGSCNKKTTSVIVECAYFIPEAIIGKPIKYDINSEAAHKYERGVDPKCHDKVLRRFIKIVENHAKIKNIQLFTKVYSKKPDRLIPVEIDTVSKIIGIDISKETFEDYMTRLGFHIKDNMITIPSHRHDIEMQNDIAEEIARAIGYDHIPSKKTTISSNNASQKDKIENKIKSLLIDNGFYEVINNPFIDKKNDFSVIVDNPLDSNRKYIRTGLKDSLIRNLIYNERRQNDSIKLFELSDIYSLLDLTKKKKVLGIIASGRVDKNYVDFTKKINNEYLFNIIKEYVPKNLNIEIISRDSLNSKSKNQIIYTEIDLDKINSSILEYEEHSKPPLEYNKYNGISEYPSSSRDLSFSIKKYSQSTILENSLLEYKHELLKDIFIFDYFKNDKANEIKIAFRFTFQSKTKTITDQDVNNVINDIIEIALSIDSVSIPGLKK